MDKGWLELNPPRNTCSKSAGTSKSRFTRDSPYEYPREKFALEVPGRRGALNSIQGKQGPALLKEEPSTRNGRETVLRVACGGNSHRLLKQTVATLRYDGISKRLESFLRVLL